MTLCFNFNKLLLAEKLEIDVAEKLEIDGSSSKLRVNDSALRAESFTLSFEEDRDRGIYMYIRENILVQLLNNRKKYMPYFILAIMPNILCGCDLKSEKSYEYYLSHPYELQQDYKNCEKHPGSGVCVNIVKKYARYIDHHHNLSSGSQNGYIFRNIDEPIDSLSFEIKG